MSLSSGSGARRLAEARTRAAIQLLLVQACGEVCSAVSPLLLFPGLACYFFWCMQQMPEQACMCRHALTRVCVLPARATLQVYAAHSPRLPQAAAILMLDALAEIAQHARDIDADLALRRDLAAAQAEGKVWRFLFAWVLSPEGGRLRVFRWSAALGWVCSGANLSFARPKPCRGTHWRRQEDRMHAMSTQRHAKSGCTA